MDNMSHVYISRFLSGTIFQMQPLQPPQDGTGLSATHVRQACGAGLKIVCQVVLQRQQMGLRLGKGSAEAAFGVIRPRSIVCRHGSNSSSAWSDGSYSLLD